MIGVVAIGRNEGERFKKCIQSLLKKSLNVVYVDSGSTDDSVAYAQSSGIDVVELDMSIPFTAARARNAGFDFLLKKYPTLQYVQFIDGDCELAEDWIDKAVSCFRDNDRLAVVCGRQYEKFPDASVYNQLIDMEWNTPVGEAEACGGASLMRVEMFQAVGGFNPSLICGEEPELCIRLRQKGWKIYRIDEAMSYHDADMHQLSQWWQRMKRAGWAVAEGFSMYGKTEESYMVREYRSGWLWGLIVPVVIVGLIWPTHGLSLSLLAGYVYLTYRIYAYRRQRGDSSHLARTYAYFCTLSKFPQVQGQFKYLWTRWQRKTPTLIEYKS